MTLQASGQISLRDVNIELSNTATARIGLGDSAVRTLLGVPSGPVALSDGYGKFVFTLPPGGTGGAWVPTSDASWGTFMNTYAIWNQETTTPTVQTFEAPIYFPVSGTYTIQYAVDDLIGFEFDTGYITYNEVQSTGAESSGSRSIVRNFNSGYHTIYITVSNSSGPWGVAMTVSDPGNNLLWNTRNTNFQNGNFDSGSLVNYGSYADFGVEWTIQLSGVNLNGVDTILGYPTPIDTTFPWPNMSGEKDVHNASLYTSFGAYTVQTSTDVPSGSPVGTQSIRLAFGEEASPGGTWFSSGNAYGTSRGPYLISNEFVTVSANKNVKFWYKALGLVDAYDIYAYIVEIYTGTKITILDESGQTTSSGTTWTEVTTTVPTAGVYKFVFVCGSWDATGGLKTGAALLISRISVEQ